MVTQGEFIVSGVPGWVPPARRKRPTERNHSTMPIQSPRDGAARIGRTDDWGDLTIERRLQMLEAFVDEIGSRLAQLEGVVFALKHTLHARERNAGCAPERLGALRGDVSPDR